MLSYISIKQDASGGFCLTIFHLIQLYGLFTAVLSSQDCGRKSTLPLLKKTRKKAKRKPMPTYGIIDSQSTKTIYASNERGFDGGKKVKGRKRHIVVDIMGNLLAIKVHAANIHDTKAGIDPASAAYTKYPTIKKFCGDAGYRQDLHRKCR